VALGNKRQPRRTIKPEFGPWLRVMSPKCRYGGINTWDHGVKRESKYEGRSYQVESDNVEAVSGSGCLGGNRSRKGPVQVS
jgi:hypothetical protein